MFEEILDGGDYFGRFLSVAMRAGSAAGRNIMIEQLLASSGHRVSIQSQEVGQQSIPATAKRDGFQAPVKTPLLLVEQAVEKQNGGFEFLGRDLESADIGHHRNRLRRAPR